MSIYIVTATSHRDGVGEVYRARIGAPTADAAYQFAYSEAPHILGSTEYSRERLITVNVRRESVVSSMGEPSPWEYA